MQPTLRTSIPAPESSYSGPPTCEQVPQIPQFGCHPAPASAFSHLLHPPRTRGTYRPLVLVQRLKCCLLMIRLRNRESGSMVASSPIILPSSAPRMPVSPLASPSAPQECSHHCHPVVASMSHRPGTLRSSAPCRRTVTYCSRLSLAALIMPPAVISMQLTASSSAPQMTFSLMDQSAA